MSDLERDLQGLSRALRTSEPDPRLADAVLRRVTAHSPRRDRRVTWALVGAVVVVLLGLAVSPVGAKIVGWLDFSGVMVRGTGEVPSRTPAVPSEAGGSLRGATFSPLTPSALGPPEGVAVSRDGGLVSMTWEAPSGTIRLDQFDAGLDPYFWKTSPTAEFVRVAGRDALWFPDPHPVVVVPDGGTPSTHAPRLAGQTLVVVRGALTLRLEGTFPLARAVAILESLE